MGDFQRISEDKSCSCEGYGLREFPSGKEFHLVNDVRISDPSGRESGSN